MRKTKEYSSDVQQKIVELHKIENGCKKIAKALKNPMHHQGNNSEVPVNQSKDVTNLPGRGKVSISSLCTVRMRVWVAKDPPRITAGELQRLVKCWGLKPKKNDQTAPASPQVVWEGFKKNPLLSSRNKLQHIQLSDMIGTSKGTSFGQMNLKNDIFGIKTMGMGLVQTGIKSNPCPLLNILLDL